MADARWIDACEQDKNCFGLLRDALTLPRHGSSGPQVVGLVTDQRANPQAPRASVDFLRHATMLPTGAARLHLETDASLWFAAVLHDKRFYDTGSRDPSIKPFRLILRRVKPGDRVLSRSFVVLFH